MVEPTQAVLNAFPSSAYAAELKRSAAGSPFRADLEAEFGRIRLRGNRTVVRVVALLAVVLTALRGADQILNGVWTPLQTALFAAVIVASITLCTVAWSPWFEKLYLRVANVLVPLRSTIVAAALASALTREQMDAAMFLPPLVIGPFFFLGLHFRVALLTAGVSIAAYVVSAWMCGMDTALLLRTALNMLLWGGASAVVARHLEREARRSFLERRLIEEVAQHDPLTGLKNRRIFDERLGQLWRESAAARQPLAVLLIDVDHFKDYNDRYGHQAGDRALRKVAQTLLSFVTGPRDFIGRYGGEEFAVVLHDCDAPSAEALAQRMRSAVGELSLDHDGQGSSSSVTISVGVASVLPSIHRRSHGAVQLADQALYDAKINGRNRVVVMDRLAHDLLETGVFTKVSNARG